MSTLFLQFEYAIKVKNQFSLKASDVFGMVFLKKNKRNLTAVSVESEEEHRRNNLSKDTNAPTNDESTSLTIPKLLRAVWPKSSHWSSAEQDPDTKRTVKVRQAFSKVTSPDESGIVLGNTRDTDRENHECNADSSQNDPDAEMDASVNRPLQRVIAGPGSVLHRYLSQ